MSLDADFQTFTAAMNDFLPLTINFMLLPLGAVVVFTVGEILLTAVTDFFSRGD